MTLYMCFSVIACVLLTDLQYVAPDVVSEGPAQAVQDVQHLFLLQHGEEAVKKDLEPDRHRLGAVQHQAADVEHHIGLNDLHLGRVVQVLGAQLVQSCVEGEGEKKKHTHTHANRKARLKTIKFLILKSTFRGYCTVSTS